MLVYSQLKSAQLENRSSDYSAGVLGRFWINTTSLDPKFDNGSRIKIINGHTIGNTTFSIGNGQSAQDVTGLLIAGGTDRSAIVSFSLRRKDDAEIRVFTGHLYLVYDDVGSSWSILEVSHGNVGDSGVTFSVTAAGQVQYTSDTMSGGNYTGNLKFRVEAFDA